MSFIIAATGTITESSTAIAIAREGGIGVIHKDTNTKNQVRQVAIMKRAENDMTYDSVTVLKGRTVKDALEMMANYHISNTSVVDKESHPVDIVTSRDPRFECHLDKLIGDVMTKKSLVTTHQQIGLITAAHILQEDRIEKLPIVDRENRLIGLIIYKNITGAKNKPVAREGEKGRLRIAASTGVTADIMERAQTLVTADVDAITTDTARGHSVDVVGKLHDTKSAFPNLDVVVGNAAIGEAAKFLVGNGVDTVKVGIGPGSICVVRIVAGAGVSQLSTIYDVCKALGGTGAPLIADDGLRHSGDVIKALAAGGSSAMVGSLIAGTEGFPGDTIIFNGRKFKSCRGMGPLEVMEQKDGSRDRYFRGDADDTRKFVPEGIAGRVPYKGTIQGIIYWLVGGLHSGMRCCSVASVEDLCNAEFTRIANAGVLEGHPHDISITGETSNYSCPK